MVVLRMLVSIGRIYIIYGQAVVLPTWCTALDKMTKDTEDTHKCFERKQSTS